LIWITRTCLFAETIRYGLLGFVNQQIFGY